MIVKILVFTPISEVECVTRINTDKFITYSINYSYLFVFVFFLNHYY